MVFTRNQSEVIVKFTDEGNNIFKIGLGSESLSKSDDDLKELAIEKYNEIKYRELNPPAPSYTELRRAEYPSTDEMIVALWEKVVEGRNEEAERLQAKRVEVKEKYPKN
ncbi:MAG: hypothetical protein AB1432_01585 [Bacteroidota bacterium]